MFLKKQTTYLLRLLFYLVLQLWFSVYWQSNTNLNHLLIFHDLIYLLNIFFLFFAVFRFDLFGTDVSKYTNLNLAKKNIDIIFNLLCLQSILFVLKNKYPKIVNIEIILWILMFLLIPYFIYQIPSIQQAYNFGA